MMIVVRHTHKAKNGHGDELVELLKDWLKVHNRAGRVYTIRDDWDTVCVEEEFAAEEDFQKVLDNWDPNDPDHAELWKRFLEIRGSNTIREILIVH
jgi:hypothetical protein